MITISNDEMEELVFGERRLHHRKRCLRQVDLDTAKGVYTGYLRDLSFGGAFVEIEPDFVPVVGKRLVVCIPMKLQHRKVKLRGEIVRTGLTGIGLRFIRSRRK